MYLMVLDDGKTYSAVEGCKIVNVPDDSTSEDIEGYLGTYMAKEHVNFKKSEDGDIEVVIDGARLLIR